MLNQILKLERSLYIFDIESTGLDPSTARIIQIGLTQHAPDKEPIRWVQLVNPTVPILNTVEGKHGITDADVTDKPTFARIAPALGPKLLHADLAGHHIFYDIDVLRAEMKRADVSWPWDGHAIDTCNIYRTKKPHTLINAYKEYVDEKGYDGAHDAGRDVDATEAVLIGQLNRYQDLPRTVKDLSEFCFPPVAGALDREGKFIRVNGEVVCNFGGAKGHRGKRLKDVPRSYLEWMLSATFQDDTKKIVEDALNGVYL